MNKVKYVFVILVYRNLDDLEEFLENIDIKMSNKSVIIVNSFYDVETKEKAEELAKQYKAIFINVENKGYSYGNNRGIELAKRLFDFDYLIVSNPDIIIEKFDDIKMNHLEPFLIGPITKNRNNKNQNPYRAFKLEFFNKLLFIGYKKSNKFIIKCAYAVHRAIRELFLVRFLYGKKQMRNVYALHGSFMIFSRGLVNLLELPFNERMFLFNEEFYIAKKLEKKNIRSYITKKISILHKEDGSMSLASINENSEIKKSLLICYEELKGDYYE